MRSLFIFLFLLPSCLLAQSYDLLLKGGKVIDGSGNPWFYGDVAVRDGRVCAIGHLDPSEADTLIDVSGLVIAPGFIDVHAHIERNDLTVPTADNFIFDGVTSVITGNCGSSRTDISRYFFQLDSVRTSVNVASLIGHNSVRAEVMGTSRREPSAEEQGRMEALVEQAMRAGAVGFSTGLIYTPGTYSKMEEVVGLAKVAARYKGVYASHIRNEGDHVTEAIAEALNIGQAANIPVQISHFKVMGKPNWGRSEQTLAQVEAARNKGIDVTIDQYPYIASSTTLNAVLPSWAFSGGTDSLMARLKDTSVRRKIISEMLKNLKEGRRKNYDYAVVARYDKDSTFNGKSISEINRLKGGGRKAPDEARTILEMVENGSAQMVYFGMDEKDVRRIMKYPFSMIASDAGIVRLGEGSPHPRSYGTNARVLGHYVDSLKLIRLEEAIRRMTSLPAQKFNLRDRGLLREGFAADIVVFDPGSVADRSTFKNPHAYSTGFAMVIVNGSITMAQGKHTGARGGTILRPTQIPGLRE